MSAIKVSAYRWVPPFAQGLVRDLRVRWALEEAGLPYEERLLDFRDKPEGYRKLQPFGQVPTFEDGALVLFESGAIVQHIAERSGVLLPSDPSARARAMTWMFSALNTVEPPIMFLVQIDLKFADDSAAMRLREGAVDAVKARLDGVAAWLDGRDYLEDRFTAGDLLMATVLRIPRHTDLVASMPVLAAYLARCEARPAFQKALAAQMAVFANNAAPTQL
ncbi:glutathione S-transferase family protein [Reyranella soli]|uniref:Glutathione S-transferase n=1 Tax=Reyranella soli TaxID=1230389 RepID=A0A512NBI6_9HYPH|nr:glutathione S-transferase family protein [Reyranella soli]GEP56308.1 glutathione S-transferase [Reyranella soli]